MSWLKRHHLLVCQSAFCPINLQITSHWVATDARPSPFPFVSSRNRQFSTASQRAHPSSLANLLYPHLFACWLLQNRSITALLNILQPIGQILIRCLSCR